MPSTSDVTRYQQARADAHDNADYFAANSAAKARAFITAVERLLLIVADQSERSGGESVRFDKRLWLEQKQQAQAWLNAREQADTGGGVSYYRTGGGRNA